MVTQPARYGVAWSRDEVILALALYCQIPFARTKANNPAVAQLARLVRRTPASVARKLGNLGACDPGLAERGISGLGHHSKLDGDVWAEFYGHWSDLVAENERVLAGLGTDPDALLAEDGPAPAPAARPQTERVVMAKVRLQQSFFRRAVLASYGSTCCICEIEIPELLIASHIIPWAVDESTRVDPQNGLCLCALHDRAFDRGLIAVATDTSIVVSARVQASDREFTHSALARFTGTMLHPPRKFHPKPEYLEWHRTHVYEG